MGCNARKVSLSSLGTIVTGKTPSTKFEEYYGGETPFLTPSDDMTRKYLPNTARTLSVSGVEIVKRCLVPAGSLSMSCIGSDLGKVVMNTRSVVTNQQINTLVPNPEIVDKHYLYYALIPLGRRLNALSKTSTAVPIVNKSQFSECEIFLPDMETQFRVGHILTTLDDKIELNLQLNDYLAELLLAKYDQLFGAFDSDSCDGILSDIGEVVGGATPSKKNDEYFCHDGIGWITPRDLSNTTDIFIAHGADDITQAGYDSCSAKLLPKGSVLFSSRAPIGYLAIATDEVATNQGFKSIIPNDGIGSAL